MAASALPSLTDFNAVATVDDLRQFLRVDDNLWTAIIHQIGDPGPHIRVLAALPAQVIVQSSVSATLATGDNLTAVQATHVGLLWRSARKIVHGWAGLPEATFIDVDPWAVVSGANAGDGSQATTTGAGQSSGGQVKERVLKMSSLLDQGDDSELVPASRDQIDSWLANYTAIMGNVPQEEEEPSEAQLAALNKRVAVLKGAPYCDFAIWTPFSRKNLKLQKFRMYVPLGDGSFLMRELPGPQNFQQWTASWRVYRTACIMLNIASLSVLMCYEKTIERLTIQWPRCWGLVCYAEDKARAEKLDKIRRKFQQDKLAGKDMPAGWTEDNPWNACFQALANDEDFWNEQVRHPAASWMAAGGRGALMAPAEQAAMAHSPGVQDGGWEAEHEPKTDNRRKQANRDKRAAKLRKIKADREELELLRNRGGSAGRGSTQEKGKGKGKSKDQAGTQICYSFANGTGVCGSVEPGGACLQKVKRAHKCQFCLSPGHRNADCPKNG